MCMDGFPDTPVHPRHPVAFSVDHLGSIPVYDVTWFREMARSSGLSGLGLWAVLTLTLVWLCWEIGGWSRPMSWNAGCGSYLSWSSLLSVWLWCVFSERWWCPTRALAAWRHCRCSTTSAVILYTDQPCFVHSRHHSTTHDDDHQRDRHWVAEPALDRSATARRSTTRPPSVQRHQKKPAQRRRSVRYDYNTIVTK